MKIDIGDKELVIQLEYLDIFNLIVEWELTNPKHSFIDKEYLNDKLKSDVRYRRLSDIINTNEFMDKAIEIHLDVETQNQTKAIEELLQGKYKLSLKDFNGVMDCYSDENDLYHYDDIQDEFIKIILNLQ